MLSLLPSNFWWGAMNYRPQGVVVMVLLSKLLSFACKSWVIEAFALIIWQSVPSLTFWTNAFIAENIDFHSSHVPLAIPWFFGSYTLTPYQLRCLGPIGFLYVRADGLFNDSLQSISTVWLDTWLIMRTTGVWCAEVMMYHMGLYRLKVVPQAVWTRSLPSSDSN